MKSPLLPVLQASADRSASAQENSRPHWLAFSFIASFALYFAGCASAGPFHTNLEANQPDSIVEDHDTYALGFIEFDDQGWRYNPRQVQEVQQLIMKASGLDTGSDAGVRPVVLVTYIHGWKHNADSRTDKNVWDFRATLVKLAELERRFAGLHHAVPRRVVGVYIGWPGLNLDAGLLTNLSFYSRKNTGDRVGYNGGVAEVVARVEKLHETIKHKLDERHWTGAKSQAVTIGHSFGAQVLYDTVLPTLTDRLVSARVQNDVKKKQEAAQKATALRAESFAAREGDDKKQVESFGDLVILVNPAFEASRYFNLQKLTQSLKYDDGQRPVVAIFGSDGDRATHYAFPLGRAFSTLFEHYEHGDGYIEARQHYADHNTVPWTDEFVTHTLKLTDSSQRSLYWDVTKRQESVFLSHAELKPVNLTEGPTPGWTPFYVVKVSSEIVKEHGDIWNDRFRDYLIRFIYYITSDKPAGAKIDTTEPSDASL